jgi:hypothetical protein
MRKILVAFAVLGAFAMVANAQHSVTFYFGAPETVTGPFPIAGFVGDDGYPQPDADPGTVTLGLWATPAFDWASPPDIWQGININVITTGDVTVDNVAMNNFNHGSLFSPAYRWESSSDFGTDNHFYLVGVSTFGIGGMLPDPYGSPSDDLCYVDGPEGSGFLRYWMGNVTLSGADAGGDVFLQIGMGGIARRGGVVTTDLIYFGRDGDAPLLGDDFMAMTATPEFHFNAIPEPASLILLSLAGLFLRRR